MAKYNLKPLKKTAEEILIPSSSQAVLSFVLSCITLFVVYFDYFFKLLAGDPNSTKYVQQALVGYLEDLDKLPFTEYLNNLLFWGILGVVIYLGFITIANLFIMVSNNLALKRGASSVSRFDSFSAIDEYRRVTWVFITFIFFALTFARFLPFWLGLFKIGILDVNLLALAGGIIGMSVSYYFGYMLCWVTIRNPSLLARN